MARPRDSGAVAYTPLSAPDNAHSQTQDESTVAKEHTSIWARLGTVHILVLCLGSIMLILPVLPLAWLWAESTAAAAGQEPSTAWVTIIRANWTTRIVTVCTAILRTVVTTQASVTTAMFAGIIIERVGAPLVDGPFYSTTRALSGSPSNLLLTPSLPLRETGLSAVIVTLIVLEVSMTIAIQFLSTLLVADFGNGVFTGPSNATNVRILNDYQGIPNQSWWSMRPTASWTFAERSEPYVTGSKYDDTGHTYRAFLPYSDESQRTSIRHFRGPVTIVDQRVVCVQPTLRDLRLDALSTGFPRLTGQIAIANNTYPMLQRTESQSYLPFTCALTDLVTNVTRAQEQTSLCRPNNGAGWDVSAENVLVPRLAAINDSSLDAYVDASLMFMLLDIVSSAAIRHGVIQEVRSVENNDTTISPWAIIGNGTDAPVVRVTACMTSLDVDTFTADLDRKWEVSEPAMSWNRSTARYNTTTTLTQLGAVLPRQPLDHRGVLALSPRSDWQPFSSSGNVSAYQHYVVNTQILGNAVVNSLDTPQSKGTDVTPEHRNQIVNAGVGLSWWSSFESKAHDAHIGLFQDTLNQTQSPAMALQALLTRICQMAYYDSLLRIDESEVAEAAFSDAAVFPTQWTGFGIGMGLLLGHCVVVGIVVGLFARYTRHSLLGNHWQAVSQVYSEDTATILEKADRMKDRDIKRWLKGKGHGGKLYSFARDEGDGRVALRVNRPD
ncbi:hypothetical protein N7491_003947 [Penicillium cf. griseofulvum]|uniref:Uncharacterized protein n=1 Tax=Penicillium cf. griseofulvum TaxID=2972120 RepID=A0A9W9T109_9EURO|nr:hypothetical protein N7472_001875 [Penicillium cf. griseofulvum]KAJ5437395.1 hypothetical protein N7445_005939 [Penicillium cf. griseofulvum]KAJ5441541.1 hypothetical protein N7491_003947 [Penicillium cf. griseofulvum]